MQTKELYYRIKIVKIATYKDGLTQDEVLAKAEELGLRLLTNNEIDELLNSRQYEWKQYEDCFPCWTGTHVDYNRDECTVTENGKSEKIKLPKENGWYLKDKYGIPSEGERLDWPSPHDNIVEELDFNFHVYPRARWLVSLVKNSCLIARYTNMVVDCEFYASTRPVEFTGGVLLNCESTDRLGALGTPLEKIQKNKDKQ